MQPRIESLGYEHTRGEYGTVTEVVGNHVACMCHIVCVIEPDGCVRNNFIATKLEAKLGKQ